LIIFPAAEIGVESAVRRRRFGAVKALQIKGSGQPASDLGADWFPLNFERLQSG
jgi:hypothetical protein